MNYKNPINQFISAFTIITIISVNATAVNSASAQELIVIDTQVTEITDGPIKVPATETVSLELSIDESLQVENKKETNKELDQAENQGAETVDITTNVETETIEEPVIETTLSPENIDNAFNDIVSSLNICNPTTYFDDFQIGSVNGQFGWNTVDPIIDPNIDQAIVENTTNTYGFGCKSWRISNAYVNTAFGNQPFSAEVNGEAGETTAEAAGRSEGPRYNQFTAEFSFASATPGVYQPGLSIDVSPDRGDGARMANITIRDKADGLSVATWEYDIDPQNVGPVTGSSFNEIEVTLDRNVAHTLRIVTTFIDGPGNDIVEIYVNNNLVHTGTTWEDKYCYYNNELPKTVDSLLFRPSGQATTALQGAGLLIDNFSSSVQSVYVNPELSILSFDNLDVTCDTRAGNVPETPNNPSNPGGGNGGGGGNIATPETNEVNLEENEGEVAGVSTQVEPQNEIDLEAVLIEIIKNRNQAGEVMGSQVSIIPQGGVNAGAGGFTSTNVIILGVVAKHEE